MTIDPWIAFWFGVWTNILILVAGYGFDHAPAAIALYAPTAQWISGFIAQINGIILTAMMGLSSNKVGPLVSVPALPPVTPTIVKILLVAFTLSFLVAGSPAMAQGPKPFKPTGNLVRDTAAAFDQTKAAVTGQPAPDPAAALPCMDIKMLIRLTPENLVPTMKACVQDMNNQLVSDTSRALDSANAYVGPNGGATGDNDAVNCLKPALSLFKAAAIVPAVPEVPAVLSPDGTVKTAAVPGTPELDPGPVLLFQKYREFTLAGALTSCQSWFNSPINATAAAGVAGVGAVAGAALLMPK